LYEGCSLFILEIAFLLCLQRLLQPSYKNIQKMFDIIPKLHIKTETASLNKVKKCTKKYGS
jgi:hypothetical protein